MLFDYDNTDEKSIFEYAKKLEGRTFNDVWNDYIHSPVKHYGETVPSNMVIKEDSSYEYFNNTKSKGLLGHAIERYYFGYELNSDQKADFEATGIELKQTCMDLKKDGSYTAGERLSITNISYKEPVEDDFYKSHVWEKIHHILLIHYLRDKSINQWDYKICFVNLFTPPENDLKIIIDDYKKINTKIKLGLAHELSEGDTLYLGACTKGQTAEKSLQPQYYNPQQKAKKRNYCLKHKYMNYVLQVYILRQQVPYESIMLTSDVRGEMTFEQLIQSRIARHIGKTDLQLCTEFDREYNNNKAQWVDLTYRMLGIKGNHAEEFVKAGVSVRAIRINDRGTITESMSFTPFKFKDLVKQKWEDSPLHQYFEETRFLFVVFKDNGKSYTLLGSQMWNMPYEDLEVTFKEGWTKIRDKVRKGITFTIKNDKVMNDLPKKKDNPIMHIRPHAEESAYILNNGYVKGNYLRDANELPDGQWMTTQSFWLNNDYVLKQLDSIVGV